MSRIAQTLEALKQQGKKALIPYLVAGDPIPGVTVSYMHALVDKGADIIELGVPFSDPMAEGPVIQRAHERALAHGTSLRDALAAVKEFRKNNQGTPVILMGYANPVEAMGYQAFCDAAVDAGLDGLLTVDLPPEEAAEFNTLLKAHELDNIFLISPTTSQARVEQICEMATGFLYYVSLKGVTGAASLDISEVSEKVAQIRSVASQPICVGFGIKDGESAQQIANLADGVVVGSALVNLFAEGDAGLMRAGQLLGEMRQAIDA